MEKTLTIDPCVPKSWPSYQVTYRVGKTTFQISVENPAGVNRGVTRITLDGKVLNGNEIPLREDDGEHQVIVVLGAVAATPG